MLRLLLLLLLLLSFLHLLLSAPVTESADYELDSTPSAETEGLITCYQCYVHKRADQTTVYLNTTELLTLSGVVVGDDTGDVLDLCRVIPCSEACVIATSTLELLPAALAYPTAQPWYVTTVEPTDEVESVQSEVIELEYRTCAAPSFKFDMCASFTELNSEDCRQESCQGSDLCNKDFKNNTDTQLIIIIVSVLVCAAIVGAVLYRYLKIRTPTNYQEVDEVDEVVAVEQFKSSKRGLLGLRPSFCAIKEGSVKQEVTELEEKIERGGQSRSGLSASSSASTSKSESKSEDKPESKDEIKASKDISETKIWKFKFSYRRRRR